MRDMAEGRVVPEFRPRKHDLLAGVFVDFNALIRIWNARIGSDQPVQNGTEESASQATRGRVAEQRRHQVVWGDVPAPRQKAVP
jgi:hypothetical protein